MVVKPSEQRAPAVNDEELVRQQIAECGKYNTETEVEEMMGQYKAGKPLAYITGESVRDIQGHI
jgi:hypothetical protein